MGIFNIIGALLITYGVSRVLLLVSRRLMKAEWQLAVVHIATWLVIAGALAAYRWNPVSGYDSSAGYYYLLPQLAWYLLDRVRQVWNFSRV